MHNPFIVRGMIKSEKSFWGRKRELSDLYSFLYDSDEEPQSVAVIGQRRIGKSSLLYRIWSKSRANEIYADQLERTVCVMFSMQSFTNCTANEFFIQLLDLFEENAHRYKAQLKTARGNHSSRPQDALSFFLRSLEKEKAFAVMLIDEFECAARNPNFDTHFFDYLRACAQQNRLAYILASQHDLKDLWNAELVHSPYSSPFFNYFQTITLRGFEEGEIKEYLTQASIENRFADSELEDILYIGGNNPFLLNVAAYNILQNRVLSPTLSQREEDLRFQLAHDPVITQCFEYYWKTPNIPQRNLLKALALEQVVSNDVASQNDLSWLERMSLICLSQNARWHIFSEAFRDMLSKSKIPDSSSQAENEDIQDLITQDESTTLEFKSSLKWDYKLEKESDIITIAVVKTIAGFLNTDGGTLIIGVDDTNTPLGLEKDYQTIKKKDRDGFLLCLCDILKAAYGGEFMDHIKSSIHQIGELEICKVVVNPSPEPVFAKKKDDYTFYVRIANSTKEFNVRETVNYYRHHWQK